EYSLASELEDAGKFDDVVFHYKIGGCLYTKLQQAKHLADHSKEITVEELLGGKKFNLKTYFESYLKIRDNFKGKLQLILCSNIKLKFGGNFKTPRLLENDKSPRVRNVNLYFEHIPGNDDILGGERLRLVSGWWKEREE